jgi:hypothetical protein
MNVCVGALSAICLVVIADGLPVVELVLSHYQINWRICLCRICLQNHLNPKVSIPSGKIGECIVGLILYKI